MGSALLPLEPRIGRLPILKSLEGPLSIPLESGTDRVFLTAKLLHLAPMTNEARGPTGLDELL